MLQIVQSWHATKFLDDNNISDEWKGFARLIKRSFIEFRDYVGNENENNEEQSGESSVGTESED